MNIIEINPALFGSPNQEFKKRLDKDLDICEFSEECKRGFLFFLGAYLPGMLTESFGKDEKKLEANIPILGLYSTSTGQFSDYGELNDYTFSYWIYNTCTLFAKMAEPDASIDSYLRTIDKTGTIIGKTKINEDFISKYVGREFDMNLIQNINDEFFTGLGTELVKNEFTLERSYEAGMAYRMMMVQMDIKGNHFLMNMLSGSLALSPLYRTLIYMPTLFYTNNHAFVNNHLFSQILNNLVGGINSGLMNSYKPIHQFHQYLFYKEGTSEIRDEWQFEKHNQIGSALPVFLNAMNIKQTGLVEDDIIDKIDIKEVFNKDVINQSITKNQLLNIVLNVINEKYGIAYNYEFTNNAEGWNDGGWNNKGEYIQFLVALYYETCLHAMVVEEII